MTKNEAMIGMLTAKLGPATEFTVTENHDTGERQIEVTHATGRKSLILQPLNPGSPLHSLDPVEPGSPAPRRD